MRRIALSMGIAATAAGGAAAGEGPQIVATTGMIADVAAEVAGDCGEVRPLMGPGTDPHLYRPTSSDIRALRQADGILFSGYGLEGQLGEVLARLSDGTSTLAVAEAAVPQAEVLSADGLHGVDPHLWMDVRLWSMTVPVVAEFVAGLAPDCEGIAERADGYAELLDALHLWVGEAVAAIPEDARALVTAHDAFAYYARAYGIEEIAIQGISTEAEASISDISGAAALVAERRIPAVFIETTINPRTVEALIAAARDAGHEVRVGGELYADAMGEAGTLAGTYPGMIVEN